MRKPLLLLLLLAASFTYAQDLTYYLPDSVTYNPAIPKPKSVIFHEVGEWHITHDRLVNYMLAVANAAPDRIKFRTMGFTHESRPQVLLVITSPKNHQNLEAIRKQHLMLTDPSRSGSLNTADMPIVVYIGHSIHGNEPSGSNAALLSAYYLAAAQGKQIDDLLDKVVILFDPSFNPDGLQRFSTWANQHKSKNLVTDPASREFNEVWPGGRFNHYWFDLNRDWLPVVHPESHNRLQVFAEWRPNLVTDHHEQGSNATFFFQPGVPSRVNPLTPKKNMELTEKLGRFHAQYLDRIGSLYFTKEAYDDFYYGKGSTYPDVQGAVGILFEQASSRGHAQQTSNGILRFPFTIKNQFTTTLSTLEGARVLRQEFLDHQRQFYKDALQEAAAAPVKAYVVGNDRNNYSTQEFCHMLDNHSIKWYHLKDDIKVGNRNYDKGHSFVIPTAQPQYKLIRGIFEKTTEYKDSLFYDITAWTFPLAYGIRYDELRSNDFKTAQGDSVNFWMYGYPQNSLQKSNYAYIIPYTEANAAGALYALLQKNIGVRVATAPFEATVNGRSQQFGYGTLMVPMQVQTASADAVYDAVSNVFSEWRLPVYGVTTGASLSGSDLGSGRFAAVTKPAVATVVGTGVNALDAGELWHLFDQRLKMPLTQLETAVFNRTDINKYNTIILVGGSYNELNKDKLKAWVQAGGNLIAMEEAVTWASTAGISNVTFKKAKSATDSTQQLRYADREQIEGAQQMRGAIFKADVDLSNPLAYGYTEPQVHLFKGNRVFMEPSKNVYATPFVYKSAPLVSGWASQQNKDAIKNSAAVVISPLGTGRTISISENPNFRGFWLGGMKLMTNAVFFGRNILLSGGGGEGE